MKLTQLIANIKHLDTVGSVIRDIISIEFDSRHVTNGSLFVAVRGEALDGHLYIYKAIESGAIAIVCEQLPDKIDDKVTYIVVQDSHSALGKIASEFYGNPSHKLKLVGITGTNGKTTIATLLYDTFKAAGYKAGLISTVSYYINDRQIPSTHTTPDAVTLNKMISEMVDCGCSYCFMEVSSHSIVQHRIEGLEFAGGVFTNITLDHLDYHKTFAEYIRAKKLFFDNLPKSAFAITNKDDKNGMVMLQNCAANKFTYSINSMSDFKCKIVEKHFDGTLLNIDNNELWVQFIGKFNASNLLAVYATASLLGLEHQGLLEIMSSLHSVRGRFEHFVSKGITAIVDYAHTPDALENVISTINDLRCAGQKLYVVVGCGGDRDRSKRPIMASIAIKDADMAILTSDNPRTEDPADIIEQMKSGIGATEKNYLTICDRRQAIHAAAVMAVSGDIILIAGKGHETYQEINGVRNHFDDMEEIKNELSV